MVQVPWNTAGNAGRESALADMEQAEIVDCVRDAVLTLPEHYRAPVTLCDLEGKSYCGNCRHPGVSGWNGKVPAEPRAFDFARKTPSGPDCWPRPRGVRRRQGMSTMTCREFDELVHAVARMELLDVQAREAVLEHSGVCPHCAARMAEAIALADALDARGRQVREAQAPMRVESELVAAFRAHHRRMAWRRTIEWACSGRCRRDSSAFPVDGASAREKFTAARPAQTRADAVAQARSMHRAKRRIPVQLLPRMWAKNLTAESAQDSSADGTYTAADFVPIPYTGAIASDDAGMVVRVQMTRASLAQLGYPVADEPGEDLVRADVLVDEDGWPRGVKLVQ